VREQWRRASKSATMKDQIYFIIPFLSASSILYERGETRERLVYRCLRVCNEMSWVFPFLEMSTSRADASAYAYMRGVGECAKQRRAHIQEDNIFLSQNSPQNFDRMLIKAGTHRKTKCSACCHYYTHIKLRSCNNSRAP
jgi:hypothetical protein